MDQQLFPFLFQRARRTLPVTVKSDSGLAEGEIWFIEGCELTVWCVEKLESASRYEMRADVKTIGGNVDLVAEIVEVMHGRDAGQPGGYLHRGEFVTFDPADEQRLLSRFWQLNPEHAPGDVRLGPPPRKSDPPAPRAAPPAPRAAPPAPRAAPPRPQDREPDRGATRTVDSASCKPTPSATTRSRPAREPARRAPTPGERRRLREASREVAGVPEPPLARDKRVAADVAPGDPPSAFVRYGHREVMQADVLLRGEDVWFFIGCHPLLWEGQELALFVQLPAGHVVQLKGKVAATRKQHCVVESRRLHASLVANLRAALGV